MKIARITKISKTYKHIGRYRQILSILVKYGFGDILQKLNITKYINIGKNIFLKKDISGTEIGTEVRIRKVFEELGPAFIKLGQIMSTRPDLITPELIIELRKLQDTAAPFPSENAIKIIEEELEKKLDEIFIEFDEIPLASASISQVHYAKLKNKDEVVIKVQRPDIKKIIEIDIEIMLHLAGLLEKYIDEMSFISPVAIIEEFSRSIEKEIDFCQEIENIERFSENLSHDPTIHIPKVYKDLSGSKAYVMEYIKGDKLSDLKKKGFSTFDRNEIIDRGAKLILKQIFDYGFFHADPHPGNILVLENNVICFLDYGMMGTLRGKFKEHFGDLMIGIISKDSDIIAKSIVNLSYSIEFKDKEIFERDIEDLLDTFMDKKLNEINIPKLLQKFLILMVENKIKIKPEFYLLIKTILTIEGVGRDLNPEFNIIQYLEPFSAKIFAQKYNIKKIFKETRSALFDFLELTKDLPGNVNNIISKLKSGSFKIESEQKGLEKMLKGFEKSIDHLTVSIVIMSIFISSSLIILSKVPPLWNDFPLLGLIGLIIASIMSIILVFSLLKNKRE